MRRVLIFIVATMALASGADIRSTRADGVQGIRVIHQDDVQIRYSVVLEKRLEVAELDRLSKRIMEASPKTKVILIAFYLRGMAEDGLAWAASTATAGSESFAIYVKDSNMRTNPPAEDLRVGAVR